MGLELKHFQRRALATLEAYLERAGSVGADAAFAQVAHGHDGRVPTYRKIPGLEAVPYVCLRLPTGGGKTLLAAHSIRIAARSYLGEEFPVVLWLVPTNTIRAQTLEALKNPAHAYRQALDEAFEDRVAVFDVADVQDIRPRDLADRVCIVVGTLATLRVSDTAGRKVYAHHENLEPHFARVPPATQGLERIEEGPDQGQLRFSFANLLHRHRPLVLMDEAHNARTKLTFEVLQRVSPACILEFTATPDHDARTGSNVLVQASAAELKAEEMIKLPIVLTEHPEWQSAVSAALATRRGLAALAAKDPGGIRPLVLFQAENKDKPVTVEVLRQHLIDVEKLPAEAIAVATGNQRELDGIDLFDPTCPVEAIVTVQALKEGWDCSFAYVFCSVANIHSSRDVEQLLGRVLRMPYAQKRPADELNKAYAHVSSPSFAAAAHSLHDSLVAMGFEPEEVGQFVQQALPGHDELPLFRVQPPLRVILPEVPDLKGLSPEEQRTVSVQTLAPGRVEVVVAGDVSAKIEERLVGTAPRAEQERLRGEIAVHRQQRELRRAPSERGEPFSVPRLCVRVQGELELAEREVFLGAAGWNLLDYPAELAGFRFDAETRSFVFDVRGDRVVWEAARIGEQLGLPWGEPGMSQAELVRWLDRQARSDRVRQVTLLEFARRVVEHLLEVREYPLADLAVGRFALAKALQEKVQQCYARACEKGFQQTLFGPEAAPETSFEYAFCFAPNLYPANWYYRGGYRFARHFYPLPGELGNKGEEFECAQILDALPQVKYWVRNLAQQPRASFWLPTATDSFYPDFVALLNDGRILVVEYKGAHLATAEDAKRKRAVGELWEAESRGRGLFVMAEKRDGQGRELRQQLAAKVGGP